MNCGIWYEATRSGCSAANRVISAPASECPARCTRRMPSASVTVKGHHYVHNSHPEAVAAAILGFLP